MRKFGKVLDRDFHRRIGVLAQLVERLNGIEEVRGSNPLGSSLRSAKEHRATKRCARRVIEVSKPSAAHKSFDRS